MSYKDKQRARESVKPSGTKPAPGSRKYPYRSDVFFYYRDLKTEIPYKLYCTFHKQECSTKDYKNECKFQLGESKQSSKESKVDKHAKKRPRHDHKETKGEKSHYER